MWAKPLLLVLDKLQPRREVADVTIKPRHLRPVVVVHAAVDVDEAGSAESGAGRLTSPSRRPFPLIRQAVRVSSRTMALAGLVRGRHHASWRPEALVSTLPWPMSWIECTTEHVVPEEGGAWTAWGEVREGSSRSSELYSQMNP